MYTLEARFVQARVARTRFNGFVADAAVCGYRNLHDAATFFVSAPRSIGIVLFADLQGVFGSILIGVLALGAGAAATGGGATAFCCVTTEMALFSGGAAWMSTNSGGGT